MTSSLRSRVVEAGARAIGQLRFDETNRAHRQGFYESDGEWAVVVLDAMLDCLTENADEWAEETRMPLVVGGDALALVAALREDR